MTSTPSVLYTWDYLGRRTSWLSSDCSLLSWSSLPYEKKCMSLFSLRMPSLQRQRRTALKLWRKRNFNAKPVTNPSLANRLWLFTWEGIPVKNLSSVFTVLKPLPSQQTWWHTWELTQERNPTLALCVEDVSPSPPRLLRTCALTLVSGPLSVLSVEWHLLRGEFLQLFI